MKSYLSKQSKLSSALINQSINQPVSQSVNQLIYQSIFFGRNNNIIKYLNLFFCNRNKWRTGWRGVRCCFNNQSMKIDSFLLI